MSSRELKPKIHSVGAIDWDRRLFDELIPLPDGTSYNAYLVQGSDKTALLDTVDPDKTVMLMEQLVGVERVDYVISHHAEQDHSGAISCVLRKYPGAKVVSNIQCKEMLIDHLSLEEYSLAKALKAGGYHTWHVGKWHLGKSAYYPDRHGFEVNLGGCHWGMPYNGYFSPWGIPTLEDGPEGEYLTDRLTDEAIRLIENNNDGPFFLNLWHYAVHVPIQARQEKIKKYEAKARAMGFTASSMTPPGEVLVTNPRWLVGEYCPLVSP